MHIAKLRAGTGRRHVRLLVAAAGLLTGSAAAQTTNSGVGLYPSEEQSHPLNEPAIDRPSGTEHLGGSGNDAAQGQRPARPAARSQGAPDGQRPPDRP